MKTLSYIMNNFAHDLFTGIWFGSFVGIYITHQNEIQLPQPQMLQSTVHAELLRTFFWFGTVSFFLVMGTGFIRFLYRRDWDTMEQSVLFKKPILIVKHALLGFAFIAGGFYAYIVVF